MRLAAQDGVSLDARIAVAVTHQIGTVETAAEFLKRRSAGASPAEFDSIMAQRADKPPEPWDGLP